MNTQQPDSADRHRDNYQADFRSILRDMIKGMTEAPLTDSISLNFMIQMIPHHQAAVSMAEEFLRHGSDQALRTIASQIITEQTAGISNMQAVLKLCSSQSNHPRELFLYQNQMNRIMETMFRQMTGAFSAGNVNRDFIYEMIPHHDGAILMSQNALQYRLCPELIPVLNAIIESQQRGVHQMRQLSHRHRS